MVSMSDVGGFADEDALRSPLEMEAEAGASGDTEVATGGKHKTEVGPTPPQRVRKKPKRSL